MHVAVVLPDLRVGGVERMRVEMARELAKRGVRVNLCVLRKGGELSGEVPPSVRIRMLDVQRGREAPLPLARFLREEKPDVVVADMWPLTTIVVTVARATRASSRVVLVDHNTLSKTPLYAKPMTRVAMRTSIRATYPLADARIVVSNGVGDDLARISGLPRAAFTTLYNAVQVETQATSGADPWGDAPRPRVLAVGRMKEQKDHATFLRAAARSGAASVAIVGDGELRHPLEALANELGLGAKLRLPGFVTDVQGWYANADVFVLSSRYEGFGNVLVEAMARGIPVVSTDCPSGPAEILSNGRFGELVPVGDEVAMANAIDRVVGRSVDRDLLMGRAAEFGVARVTDRYLALFERLSGRGHARSPSRDVEMSPR